MTRSDACEREVLIKIAVPLVGKRFHHPPLMMLDCVSA